MMHHCCEKHPALEDGRLGPQQKVEIIRAAWLLLFKIITNKTPSFVMVKSTVGTKCFLVPVVQTNKKGLSSPSCFRNCEIVARYCLSIVLLGISRLTNSAVIPLLRTISMETKTPWRPQCHRLLQKSLCFTPFSAFVWTLCMDPTLCFIRGPWSAKEGGNTSVKPQNVSLKTHKNKTKQMRDRNRQNMQRAAARGW